MFNSNEPINVEWRTCDRNGKQEKLWSFDKARNFLIKENEGKGSEKISLDIAKYLSYSEVQKNSKIANV